MSHVRHFSQVELVKLATDIGPRLQTGDILYRASDSRGPLGLPFSRLVAVATKSRYSHAALVCVQAGQPHVVEVNETGTAVVPFEEWLLTCYGRTLAVYRLKAEHLTPEVQLAMQARIDEIVAADPEYDFAFSTPDRLYCTESVVDVYQRAGFSLQAPAWLQDILPPHWWYAATVCNWVLSLCRSACRLPLTVPLYFPGDARRGMQASRFTESVFEWVEETCQTN